MPSFKPSPDALHIGLPGPSRQLVGDGGHFPKLLYEHCFQASWHHAMPCPWCACNWSRLSTRWTASCMAESVPGTLRHPAWWAKEWTSHAPCRKSSKKSRSLFGACFLQFGAAWSNLRPHTRCTRQDGHLANSPKMRSGHTKQLDWSQHKSLINIDQRNQFKTAHTVLTNRSLLLQTFAFYYNSCKRMEYSNLALTCFTWPCTGR